LRLNNLSGWIFSMDILERFPLAYARTVEQARRATLAKGGIKSNPGKPHGGRDGHAVRA
jgi:hypothetical protein